MRIWMKGMYSQMKMIIYQLLLVEVLMLWSLVVYCKTFVSKVFFLLCMYVRMLKRTLVSHYTGYSESLEFEKLGKATFCK